MLKDIKQLMTTAIENRSQIIEGLKARLTEDEFASLVAEERKTICNGCELYSENIKTKKFEEVSHLVNAFRYKMAKVRQDIHCTACGCNIETKAHSLSSKCPIQKWIAIEPKKEADE